MLMIRAFIIECIKGASSKRTLIEIPICYCLTFNYCIIGKSTISYHSPNVILFITRIGYAFLGFI